MKASNSPISGGLAKVSNRGWWGLGTEMTGRGRGRGTLERTYDIFEGRVLNLKERTIKVECKKNVNLEKISHLSESFHWWWDYSN